jgi:hypothetical protein
VHTSPDSQEQEGSFRQDTAHVTCDGSRRKDFKDKGIKTYLKRQSLRQKCEERTKGCDCTKWPSSRRVFRYFNDQPFHIDLKRFLNKFMCD